MSSCSTSGPRCVERDDGRDDGRDVDREVAPRPFVADDAFRAAPADFFAAPVTDFLAVEVTRFAAPAVLRAAPAVLRAAVFAADVAFFVVRDVAVDVRAMAGHYPRRDRVKHTRA